MEWILYLLNVGNPRKDAGILLFLWYAYFHKCEHIHKLFVFSVFPFTVKPSPRTVKLATYNETMKKKMASIVQRVSGEDVPKNSDCESLMLDLI